MMGIQKFGPEGFQQLIIGGHVRRACNQLHITESRLHFPVIDGVQDFLSIYDRDTQEFAGLGRFLNAQ